MANDSTIGVGVFLFLLLLLFCCCICGFFGKGVFSWHSVCFLTIGIFLLCVVGGGGLLSVFLYMWWVAKYPEVHRHFRFCIHLNNIEG